MKKSGTLKRWNFKKGFGFIDTGKNGEDLFVHISDFSNRKKRPNVGDQVKFDTAPGRDGRQKAIEVQFVDSRNSDNMATLITRVIFNPSTFFSLLFVVVVAAFILFEKLPWVVLYWYAVLSIVTFAFYREDKTAARLQQWRVKEKTLHLLGLFGGWPGALIAQSKLRHKSSKSSFKRILFATVFLNLVMFAWLQTQDGQIWISFIDESVASMFNQLFGILKGLFSSL